MHFLKLLIVILYLSPLSSWAAEDIPTNEEIQKFMTELKSLNKKMGWNPSLYDLPGWKARGRSVNGKPLIYWTCGKNEMNTTLILSTIHGDEITPAYFGLRSVSYISGEPHLCDKYRVVIAPLVNPDGYLKEKQSRTNANGVDVNRNFPTKDFEPEALKLWKTKYKSDPRRYPGAKASSEPETKFQEWLIDEFKPAKIMAIHAPLHFFDYDGPTTFDANIFTEDYIKSCNNLRASVQKASGNYKFLRYGYFPGSLGNFAGQEKGIPTLTLELPTDKATHAKKYFEQLKNGTRNLIEYNISNKAAIKVVEKIPSP